jgi:hypothetical protein
VHRGRRVAEASPIVLRRTVVTATALGTLALPAAASAGVLTGFAGWVAGRR